MSNDFPAEPVHSGAEPPRRQPVFNLPGAVSFSIFMLIALFVAQDYLLPADLGEAFVVSLAFSPARYVYPLAEQNLEWLWTPVTYSLLHGSWQHVLFNCLWLAAFGTPVVRRIGTFSYCVFWIVSAIAAAALHAALNWGQLSFLIGASGVVSALMGAACRFAFPRSGGAYNPQTGHLYPLQPVLAVFANRTVMAFIGIWLLGNILIGVGIPILGDTGEAVAWDAHIGGFVLGFFCFGFFDRIGQRASVS